MEEKETQTFWESIVGFFDLFIIFFKWKLEFWETQVTRFVALICVAFWHLLQLLGLAFTFYEHSSG